MEVSLDVVKESRILRVHIFPSGKLQKHYSAPHLSKSVTLHQKGTERWEKSLCFVCFWYSDAETQTMRYSAAGKRVSAGKKKRKKKRRKKKTSLRARARAWWEELHSAAVHASLSQHPSLTKSWLILDVDYPAILPASFVVCSDWNLSFVFKTVRLTQNLDPGHDVLTSYWIKLSALTKLHTAFGLSQAVPVLWHNIKNMWPTADLRFHTSDLFDWPILKKASKPPCRQQDCGLTCQVS